MPTYREMMELFDPDGKLPPADYAWGFEPELSELPETERREVERLERLSPEGLLEEALADPDVQVVLDAADGMQPVS